MRWLRRHGDVLLAVVLAVGWPVELASYHPDDYAGTASVGVVAGLVLALRRSVPLVCFAVMLAMFTIASHLDPDYAHNGLFPLVAFMVGLYTLGAHTRGLEARLAVLGVGAAIVGIASDNLPLSVGTTLFYCVFCALPWGAGLAVRLRRERVGDLQARSAALQEEAERAVALERTRIARELHDVVSHAIAVTVLQSRGGAKLVGRDDAAVGQALLAIEHTNTAALADMRRLLTLLRSQDPDLGRLDEPAPTLERLDRLVEQVRGSGLSVSLEVEGEPLPVPPGVDLSAYRIVQEALTNVLKHGGERARAVVRLRYAEDGVELEVRNTGTVAASSGTGHGLVGIRERVAVMGGTVETGRTADGYVVQVRLPYLVSVS